MSKYEAKITGSSNGFYALVVRVDEDGKLNVISHYKGRHFSTVSAAIKSTSKYIEKFCS